MKEFMFIFRGSGPEGYRPTPEQAQAATQKWMDWVGQLITQGRFISGNPLARDGKTIQGKKPMTTDGPFAEGKEFLGGYLILKAESQEKALELALGFPDFDLEGSVEVRELVKMALPQF
jgi:hypothetical protein